ncbi:flagella basal body P-ring formation protein FlgA [Humidesulfovibrio mexicanus]|uniref:Flagella basal body P-ring formation protein FlgA n=1 Tax=Humidesulfovibrio mexicanus TaxID=147047 RepID=A0A238Y0C6_9BACT|nr:flagellar basal body P-ring formation chaperone FlgA [Humidesulfovibrio mexicanus]SNR64412.1 flagella basal body P-ring formation protein FlgA [Humidesulfovibrio mexicanus]
MKRNRIAARARRTLRCLAASLVAAACLLAFAGQVRAAEMRQGWWLQVKEAACAKGPKVLLGDIALPQGEMSQEVWREMAQRPLWSAPERAGNQTALSRERLLALLRHHAQDLADACALPAQLVVQRGGSVVSAADIERRVVGYLTERSAELGGELEIKDIHVPSAIFLGNGRDRLELIAGGPLKPGRINLLFEVRGSDGKVLRRYAASAFANVWRALPCALRPLNRLQPVDLANIQFKRKNLAHNQNAWDGTGGPWRMVRSIGVDQAITMSDIEPVPVIARGDKVRLVFEGQNLRLNVKVEALADGGVGQAIEVRNLQSKRKILATVRDSSTVVVR